MISRKIIESPLVQGVDEQIAYSLTTTPWGSSPTAVAAKLYEYNAATGAVGTDVTATKMTGAASVDGDVITLPLISGLVDGTTYRLEVKFTVSGNVLEGYAYITGEA